MGGESKILGGQSVPQTQQVPQTNGPQKAPAPAPTMMPEIPVAGDQMQTKPAPKTSSKVPATSISLDTDPEKAAQAKLIKFGEDVIKAHETEIKAGKPLQLTHEEQLNLLEMTEDIIDNNDYLGGMDFRNAFQGMYSALAGSLSELRNPAPAPNKAAPWSATDDQSLAQVKQFGTEFQELLQQAVETEKGLPNADEPANKKHIRMLEKVAKDVQGDLPKLDASAKELIQEERTSHAFDERMRQRVETEKLTKTQEGWDLAGAGAVAFGVAVYKRKALVAGLQKTPEAIKEAAQWLKDGGIKVAKTTAKVTVRFGRGVVKPVGIRVRDALGIKPAELPPAQQEMLNAVRANFEQAVGKENMAAIENKLTKLFMAKDGVGLTGRTLVTPGYKGKMDDIFQDAVKDAREEVEASVKANTAKQIATKSTGRALDQLLAKSPDLKAQFDKSVQGAVQEFKDLIASGKAPENIAKMTEAEINQVATLWAAGNLLKNPATKKLFDPLLKSATKEIKDEVTAVAGKITEAAATGKPGAATIKVTDQEIANLALKQAFPVSDKELAELAAAKAYAKLVKVPGILGSVRYQMGEALRNSAWIQKNISWLPKVTDRIPLVGTMKAQPNWKRQGMNPPGTKETTPGGTAANKTVDQAAQKTAETAGKVATGKATKATVDEAGKVVADGTEKVATETLGKTAVEGAAKMTVADAARAAAGKPVMNWDVATIAAARKGVQELSWSSVGAVARTAVTKAKGVGISGAIFGTLQEAPEVASGRISGNHFVGNVGRMVTGFGGFELGAAGTSALIPIVAGEAACGPPGWIAAGITIVGGLVAFAVTDHYAGKPVATGITNGLDYVADKTGVNVGQGVKYVVYPLGKGVDYVEHNTGGFGRFTRNWLLKPFDEGDKEGSIRGIPGGKK